MNERRENVVDSLFKMLALMGGAWVTLALIRHFSEVVYACPHCHGEIQKNLDINKCSHCGVKLIWKV